MYELPGLVRNKQWRELVVYSVLISLAFTISLLQTLNIKIPNPVRDVQYFFSDLLHLRYK
jgi:hypothetical protein